MKSKTGIVISFSILIGIGFLTFFKIYSNKVFQENEIFPNFSINEVKCSVKEEEKIVRGSSLSPLIEPGATVKILFGYYNCHEIERDDIVAYHYTGNSDPIIKIAKGLPGDTFHLAKSKDRTGWNILINNEIVKNSQDQPYILNENGYQMLSLYERDYKDIIPEEAYLILGNLTSGSLDSARFGLIHKNDILGKVEF